MTLGILFHLLFFFLSSGFKILHPLRYLNTKVPFYVSYQSPATFVCMAAVISVVYLNLVIVCVGGTFGEVLKLTDFFAGDV